MIGWATGWVIGLVERYRREMLVGWVFTLGTLLAIHARTKSFWHDEIYTLLESRLSPLTLWRACHDGIDLAPPLNALLTRLVQMTGTPGPILTRLPAILGLISATLLCFAIVRRRANSVVGLTAALIFMFTPALQYGDEARSYGTAMGFFALALFGWLEASAGRKVTRNRVLMAIGLAAGVWTHYVAALAFLPITVGELVRQLRARTFDRGPWIALGVAALATLPLVSLIVANHESAKTFWTRAYHITPSGTYTWLTEHLWEGRPWIGFELVGGLAVVELARRLWRGPSSRQIPLHEIVAGAVALTLPAIGIWIGNAAGGLVIERYVLFTVVGFALVLPLAAWRLTPANGLGDLLLCLAFLLPFVRTAGHAIPGDKASPPAIESERPLLAETLAGPEPVILTGGVDYLQVWFYTRLGRQAHALYLADPAAEIALAGDDTVDRGYLALSRWTSVPVIAADRFLETHDTFLLYRFSSDWLTPKLEKAGATFEPIAKEANGELLRVHLRK
jgi:hypothetical protein